MTSSSSQSSLTDSAAKTIRLNQVRVDSISSTALLDKKNRSIYGLERTWTLDELRREESSDLRQAYERDGDERDFTTTFESTTPTPLKTSKPTPTPKPLIGTPTFSKSKSKSKSNSNRSSRLPMPELIWKMKTGSLHHDLADDDESDYKPWMNIDAAATAAGTAPDDFNGLNESSILSDHPSLPSPSSPSIKQKRGTSNTTPIQPILSPLLPKHLTQYALSLPPLASSTFHTAVAKKYAKMETKLVSENTIKLNTLNKRGVFHKNANAQRVHCMLLVGLSRGARVADMQGEMLEEMIAFEGALNEKRRLLRGDGEVKAVKGEARMRGFENRNDDGAYDAELESMDPDALEKRFGGGASVSKDAAVGDILSKNEVDNEDGLSGSSHAPDSALFDGDEKEKKEDLVSPNAKTTNELKDRTIESYDEFVKSGGTKESGPGRGLKKLEIPKRTLRTSPRSTLSRSSSRNGSAASTSTNRISILRKTQTNQPQRGISILDTLQTSDTFQDFLHVRAIQDKAVRRNESMASLVGFSKSPGDKFDAKVASDMMKVKEKKSLGLKYNKNGVYSGLLDSFDFYMDNRNCGADFSASRSGRIGENVHERNWNDCERVGRKAGYSERYDDRGAFVNVFTPIKGWREHEHEFEFENEHEHEIKEDDRKNSVSTLGQMEVEVEVNSPSINEEATPPPQSKSKEPKQPTPKSNKKSRHSISTQSSLIQQSQLTKIFETLKFPIATQLTFLAYYSTIECTNLLPVALELWTLASTVVPIRESGIELLRVLCSDDSGISGGGRVGTYGVALLQHEVTLRKVRCWTELPPSFEFERRIESGDLDDDDLALLADASRVDDYMSDLKVWCKGIIDLLGVYIGDLDERMLDKLGDGIKWKGKVYAVLSREEKERKKTAVE